MLLISLSTSCDFLMNILKTGFFRPYILFFSPKKLVAPSKRTKIPCDPDQQSRS